MSQQRKANYSFDEIEAMLNYIENCPELISGELSKNPTYVAKEWNNMSVFVNAIGFGNNRTGEQLRIKWKHLKSNTKAKAAAINTFTKVTGGGPANKNKLTEQEEKVISLIGRTCFEGVVSKDYDSSSHLLKEKNSAVNCIRSPVPYNSQENSAATSSIQVVHDFQYRDEDSENQLLNTTEEIPRQSLSERDTPQQRKRKMDFSTPRVRNMREKKKREEEERDTQAENVIMSNQKKIVEGIENMNEKFESIIKNQDELLNESRIANTHLDVLSRNVATLIQIGAQLLNVDTIVQNE